MAIKSGSRICTPSSRCRKIAGVISSLIVRIPEGLSSFWTEGSKSAGESSCCLLPGQSELRPCPLLDAADASISVFRSPVYVRIVSRLLVVAQKYHSSKNPPPPHQTYALLFDLTDSEAFYADIGRKFPTNHHLARHWCARWTAAQWCSV